MNKPVMPAVRRHADRRFRWSVAARAAGVWAVRLIALAVLAAAAAGMLVHAGLSPVLSGSMQPAFNTGDLIITVPERVQSLHAGQVAVFTPTGENAPYAHRITSISGDPAAPTLTTKGDANPVPDAWHSTLSGPTVPVVVATVPLLGHAMMWGQEPLARAFMFGLVGLAATALAVRLILRRPAPTRAQVPANAG